MEYHTAICLGMFGVGVGGFKVVEYHAAINCLGMFGVGVGGFKVVVDQPIISAAIGGSVNITCRS